MAKSEKIVFNGVPFYRYPDSKRPSHRNYFLPHIHHRRQGVSYLHVEIWRSGHGTIPKGGEIHHIDGDPLNNALDNLICLSREQHMAWHKKHVKPEVRAKQMQNLVKAQEAAKDWHRSEDGKKWHTEHAKRHNFGNRPEKQAVCKECGEVFTSRHVQPKFCSVLCGNRYRDHNTATSGKYQVVCAACGQAAFSNRQDKTVCNRRCGQRLRSQRKRLQSDGG